MSGLEERGLGLLPTSSLTSSLVSSFREAHELLRRHQLLFLWRVANNFIYGSVGRVWRKTSLI